MVRSVLDGHQEQPTTLVFPLEYRPQIRSQDSQHSTHLTRHLRRDHQVPTQLLSAPPFQCDPHLLLDPYRHHPFQRKSPATSTLRKRADDKLPSATDYTELDTLGVERLRTKHLKSSPSSQRLSSRPPPTLTLHFKTQAQHPPAHSTTIFRSESLFHACLFGCDRDQLMG